MLTVTLLNLSLTHGTEKDDALKEKSKEHTRGCDSTDFESVDEHPS